MQAAVDKEVNIALSSCVSLTVRAEQRSAANAVSAEYRSEPGLKLIKCIRQRHNAPPFICTPTCSDCPPAKAVLEENNIKFLFVDVCESVGKLKMFLKLRDTEDAFQEVREQHKVGVPCIVIDDETIVIQNPDHVRQLIEQYHLKEE